MRKSLAVPGFTALLLIVFALAQAAVPNYAGVWTLDKTRSSNLFDEWKKAGRVEMDVTQTRKQLTVTEKVAGKASDPDVYNLDGSTTKVNDAELTAKVSPNGMLELKWERELGFEGEGFIDTEVWELTGGGKTLTVRRTEIINRSPYSPPPRTVTKSRTLVFVKK